MIAFANASRPGYEACIGCRLCVLPCPVWRETHDIELTLAGRALALQRGVPVAELAASLEHCVLCGACEPVCPVKIDTVGMTHELRARLHREGGAGWTAGAEACAPPTETAARDAGGPARLLAGAAWRADARRLEALLRRFVGEGIRVAADDGVDLAVAIEAGLPVDEARFGRFIASLAGARELVVAEGILHRFIRARLPETRVIGAGEALLRIPEIRGALRPGDLYVIESRGFHADHARLVKLYDRLRVETGCAMNLDLQRMAIPTGAASLQARLNRPEFAERAVDQARWILEGRGVTRIVVENPAEIPPFAALGLAPVVSLAELTEPGS